MINGNEQMQMDVAHVGHDVYRKLYLVFLCSR